jgi:hypothetical protein
MKLRSTLLATALAALVLAPVPALARENAQRSLADAAERLRDPALQGTLATALASLSRAMVGIRMAPFAKAMESMGGEEDGEWIAPDATLGDMMGPDAQEMPRQLSEGVPRMMDGMAGMAGAFDEMLPQLEEIGRELRRSLPRR